MADQTNSITSAVGKFDSIAIVEEQPTKMLTKRIFRAQFSVVARAKAQLSLSPFHESETSMNVMCDANENSRKRLLCVQLD